MRYQGVRKVCAVIAKIAISCSPLLVTPAAHAQVKKEASIVPYPESGNKTTARPQNLKVLDEHKDGKGNIVRTIQYSQGMMRVTQTIIQPLEAGIGFRVAIRPDTMLKDSVVIVVNKSKYNVTVMYRRKPVRVYKAVFGPRPLENKLMEGDRCTPEGWFTIQNKNPNSRYDKFMLLSYPNDSAKARFARLKSAGKLPQTARIGSDVGIHGIWPGGDDMIEMGVGWTDGCVALKNRDIEELYTMVGVGTRVSIKK